MAARSPFALARATEADLDEMVHVEYACFPEDIRRIYMGCETLEDLPKIRAKHAKELRENPSDVWVKVTDLESGRIIAAGNWRIYLTSQAVKHDREKPCEWLQGQWFETADRLMSAMHESRIAAMREPFVYLHICFTHPEYRRRGAGGMVLQWGCDLADQLFLPGWIEASEEGNFLYKTFGFYDYEEIPGEHGWMNMKRDARTSTVLGGKPGPLN